VVGPPENPPDGEHVVEVLVLPPDDAAAYIEVHDPMHADVVRLAQAMRLL
jgi:8-oxo-dGTP diphosphatase